MLIQGTSAKSQYTLNVGNGERWHTAINHKNHISSPDRLIDPISQPQPRTMVRWETHITSSRIQNPQPFDCIRKLHQLRNSSVVASTITSENQRLLCPYQCLGNPLYSTVTQRRGLDRIPVRLLQSVRRQILLHRFPSTTQIHRSRRVTTRKLQRSINHLLNILPALDLPSISAVLLHDLLLIRHILYPVYVFSARSSHLTLDCVWGEPGEDENWGASTRCIMHCCSQTLGTDIDVDDYALGFAGEAGEAVRHGECYHLGIFEHGNWIWRGGFTSFGHVMMRGNWPFFSFWPLTIASIIEG